jgi:hypothetical protein
MINLMPQIDEAVEAKLLDSVLEILLDLFSAGVIT